MENKNKTLLIFLFLTDFHDFGEYPTFQGILTISWIFQEYLLFKDISKIIGSVPVKGNIYFF